MDPDAARFQALRTFGAVESTKDACRDARGTALLDNLVRDIRYAGRSFRRAPLAALTIATTVGLGLGLVAVVFTIFNAFVFLVDEVHDPYALFAVERPRSANAKPETFTHSQYDALVRESGIFTDAFARTPEIDSWIEGRRLEGPLVTGNFFQVLGVSAARGRTLVPSDDEPGGRPVIVHQPSRLDPAFCRRSGRARPHRPGERRIVPDRRRDAAGLSRTHGRSAGLLGATLPPWPLPQPVRWIRKMRPASRSSAG